MICEKKLSKWKRIALWKIFGGGWKNCRIVQYDLIVFIFCEKNTKIIDLWIMRVALMKVPHFLRHLFLKPLLFFILNLLFIQLTRTKVYYEFTGGRRGKEQRRHQQQFQRSLDWSNYFQRSRIWLEQKLMIKHQQQMLFRIPFLLLGQGIALLYREKI